MSAGWSEDALHRWLASLPAPEALVGGAQHDAAVLAALDAPPVVCADQCIEGVHFEPSADPRAVGAKAVLRTLSDLAATAAEPVAVTLTVHARRTDPEARLRAVIEGARKAAALHGASLVGGDLAAVDAPLALSVTALGRLAVPLPAPSRGRATPGQVVLLSGAVGGSLASGRHLSIEPRIAEGIAAARAGATALMDVSDGLAWDLHRLARTAGVTIELDLDRVPVHVDAQAAKDPLDAALHDGEDHELLATLDAGAWGEASTRTLADWVEVGRVTGSATAPLVLVGGPVPGSAPWSPDRGGWQYGPE